MGHYLSALAFLGNSTGNKAVLERSEYLVQELHKVQKALGPHGYLSAFPEEHFKRLANLQPVWAPFYVARPACELELSQCWHRRIRVRPPPPPTGSCAWSSDEGPASQSRAQQSGKSSTCSSRRACALECPASRSSPD